MADLDKEDPAGLADETKTPRKSLFESLGLKKIKKRIKKYSFSFIGFHYMYIIGMAIATSIMLYADRGDRGIRYIDALFFGAGACTQAGLNTINVGDLYLYQQVVILIISFITSIVTINTSVVVFRISWFRKHIENIETNSKLQSRMRRTATMVRAESDAFGEAAKKSIFHLLPGYKRSQSKVMARANTYTQQLADAATNERTLDPTKGTGSSSSSPQDRTMVDTSGLAPPVDRDIRFGDLPSPKHDTPINPEDMLRSISMMQRTRRRSSNELSDGPALVIKNPRDIAREYARKSRRNILRRNKKPQKFTSDNRNDGAEVGVADNDDADDEETGVGQDNDDDEEEDDNDDNDDDDDDAEDDDEEEPPKPVKRVMSLNPNFQSPEASRDKPFKRAVTLDDSQAAAKLRAQKRGPYNLSARDSDDEEEPTFPSAPSNRYRSAPKKFNRSFSIDRMMGRTKTNNSQSKGMSTNYLSWQPTVGRNSAFVDLTEEQKEELGGVEYRALKLLVKVLMLYNFLMPLLGWTLVLPWSFVGHAEFRQMFVAEGFNPAWWSFFTVNSSFTDLGLTLTPDSMNSFQHQIYLLLVFGFFVIAGNTGFPCLLRLILWIMFKVTPEYGRTHESVGFLLDHPRRCFTLLFPSSATWWLFAVLVALNGIDWLFFMVLDGGSGDVGSIPVGYRLFCGLFQAISTRTAGFGVVPLSALHPAVQVGYLIMMYISVFPVAISMRRTNVYEEQSLGVYYDDEDLKEVEANNLHLSYVQMHLRKQLSFDLWFIFLGLFFVCISESGHIRNGEYGIFEVLFEIVSAYGTVGLSLGYNNYDPSLSGKFNTLGKLVIIAMMIRGRHRGLPYSLDRAIMLKGEEIRAVDQIQEDRAIQRRRMSSLVPIEGGPLNRSGTASTTSSRVRTGQDDDGFRERIRREYGTDQDGGQLRHWDSDAVSLV